MAQMTSLPTHERIELMLAYLGREWNDVPRYIVEWDTWDEDEKLDFVLEWPMWEDALTSLKRWADAGLLAPSEQEEYEDILCTVAKQRPLLAPLLAE